MIAQSEKYIPNPFVSIVVLTFNQDKTIIQTIESILLQKCDFHFEIIIGEDCGTDTTRTICEKYQQKYPDKIKLILQDVNKGLIVNYADCMNACKGKYIAQCAGDDYWCDNLKLQKQIDFLENNDGYGFVRTGGYYLEEKTNKMGEITFYNRAEGNNVFEIAKYGPVGIASSICFERELLSYIDFDEFIRRKFSMEDYPMHAIFSKHTKFGYIEDLCVVYRMVQGSISNPIDTSKKLSYYEGYVAVMLYLAELFPGELECTQENAHDFLIHKQLKFSFEDFNYRRAKELASQFKQPGAKESKLIFFTKNVLMFYIGCIYKKIKK